MTPDRITKAFSPLLTARRDALAEANRTGRAVTVPVPGGYLTVRPDWAPSAALPKNGGLS